MVKEVRLSQVKEGDILVLDDTISCISPGSVEVYRHIGHLWFDCCIGMHLLDTQVVDWDSDRKDGVLTGVVDHILKIDV